MMEENSKAKRKKPRQPLYDEEEFTKLLEMVREQSLLKSMPRQASNYRAYASTAKDPGQQALIYGSGSWVTLKNHGESALICGSGLKMAFSKAINHSNGCGSLALETF